MQKMLTKAACTQLIKKINQQILTGRGSSSSSSMVPFCTESASPLSLRWWWCLFFFFFFSISSFSFFPFFFLCLDFYEYKYTYITINTQNGAGAQETASKEYETNAKREIPIPSAHHFLWKKNTFKKLKKHNIWSFVNRGLCCHWIYCILKSIVYSHSDSFQISQSYTVDLVTCYWLTISSGSMTSLESAPIGTSTLLAASAS